MKWVFGVGLVLLSLGIGTFNVWGGWEVSGNISWTTIVAGAEVMMFMALALVVIAPTRQRQAVGIVITLALAWFCVQNGKFAVKEMFSDLFKDEQGQYFDPDTLRAQAEVLRGQIPAQEAAASNAETRRDGELSRVRREIAELETERGLMLVEVSDPTQFNQQVLRAQQSLQARGEYGGLLDGVYGPLTRQAMLSRGADISTELTTLKNQERALNPTAALGSEEVSLEDISAVGVVLTQAQKTESAAAQLEEKANTIEERLLWAEGALWIIEAARAFSFWAFLMSVTASSVRTKEEDEPETEKEASEAPEAPENDNKPDIDPDAPMTRDEIIDKSIEAREEYKEADNATVIEVGPVLSTDGQEDAAA
jgi:hypothetical protein